MTPEQNRLRGRLAAHAKHHPDDVATVTEMRRDLKAARLEEHIRLLVDSAPPLTLAQRDRLALLLRAGDAA